MGRSVWVWTIFAVVMIVTACSSSTEASGVQPTCFKTANSCRCSTKDRLATGTEIAATDCGAQAVSVGAWKCSFTVDTLGSTQQCNCVRWACLATSTACNCGFIFGTPPADTTEVSTCQASDFDNGSTEGLCCDAGDTNGCNCISFNKSESHVCGSGKQVAVCDPEIRPGLSTSSIKVVPSCDGVVYAEPTASAGGSSGDTKECTSSSSCSAKCGHECYRCSSGSCECGHTGVSGACLY